MRKMQTKMTQRNHFSSIRLAKATRVTSVCWGGGGETDHLQHPSGCAAPSRHLGNVLWDDKSTQPAAQRPQGQDVPTEDTPARLKGSPATKYTAKKPVPSSGVRRPGPGKERGPHAQQSLPQWKKGGGCLALTWKHLQGLLFKKARGRKLDISMLSPV